MTARRARRARHFKGAEPIIGFERGEVQKKGNAQLEEGQRAFYIGVWLAEAAAMTMGDNDNGRRRIARRSKLLVLAASRELLVFVPFVSSVFE